MIARREKSFASRLSLVLFVAAFLVLGAFFDRILWPGPSCADLAGSAYFAGYDDCKRGLLPTIMRPGELEGGSRHAP